MIEGKGSYYDGESSARQEAVLNLEGADLSLRGIGIDRRYLLEEIAISPRLGSTPRHVLLPDGGKVEIEDGPVAWAIDKALAKGGFFASLHLWESSLQRAITALVLIAALILLFFRLGIPLLAEQAASAIPPATETRLGEESLRVLDRLFLEPSTLSERRRQELERIFVEVAADLDGNRLYRLELRSSMKLGANAFALPSGIVVLTDELAALADDDEEILAVLAHEVGHVRKRHALRQVMQNSAAGLIIATLTGDVFSTTSLAAAVPTMLADAKFSRDMEREADDLAAAYLEMRGISPTRFADILARLASEEEEGAVGGYFSTHPATEERIERLSR